MMTGRFQVTLALLKPDISVNPMVVEEVIQRIKTKGLAVLDHKTLHWRARDSELFYQQHSKRFFYRRLVEYTTCGPITALILGGENAISRWRSLMGPTKTFQACLSEPYSLRGEFGLTDTRNSTHGSDSEDSASHEIGMIFESAKTLIKEPSSKMTSLPLGSPEVWEAIYKEKDDCNTEWFLGFNELEGYVSPILKQLVESCRSVDLKTPINVIDVGCGDSMIGPNIAKFFGNSLSVFCIDFSIKALDRLRCEIDRDKCFDEVKNCQFIHADVTYGLPFDDSTISAIIDKGTIDSLLRGPGGVEKADQALSILLRLLHQGGVFLQITDESPEVRLDLLKSVVNHLEGDFRITCQSVSSVSEQRDYLLYCVFKT